MATANFPLVDTLVEYLRTHGDGNWYVLLMGPPCSGKTTHGDKLLGKFYTESNLNPEMYQKQAYETDRYVSEGGEPIYDDQGEFRREFLPDARAWCEKNLDDACASGWPLVVETNTCLRVERLIQACQRAQKYHYRVLFQPPSYGALHMPIQGVPPDDEEAQIEWMIEQSRNRTRVVPDHVVRRFASDLERMRPIYDSVKGTTDPSKCVEILESLQNEHEG